MDADTADARKVKKGPKNRGHFEWILVGWGAKS